MIGKKNKTGNNIRVFRLIIITCITMVLTIVTMLVLAYNQSAVTSEYGNITETDVKKLEALNLISKETYHHQESVFQYIISSSPGTRADLRKNSESLEKEINAALDELEKSAVGTVYESFYRNIELGLDEYFLSVDKVLAFADNNDAESAKFYMNRCLNGYIFKVNDEMSEYDSLMKSEIEKTRGKMQRRSMDMNNAAVVTTALVIWLSVFSMLICTRISRKLMNKDSLTCADNFEKFQNDCDRLTKKNRFADYTCVYFKIKDFDFYNTKFGYNTGDQVLIDIAAAAKDFLVKGEHLARDGGDNFSLLIFSEREEQVISFLKNIKIDVLGYNVPIEAYCGMYSIQKKDAPADVYAACTLAVSNARSSTSTPFIRYESKMYDEMDNRLNTLFWCSQALKNGEFLVYYQPKVNIKTNTLCGCEALVRWLHEGELIPPVKFIPILENNGSINELDFYVFRKVCSDISEWLKKGIEPVRVSSNFSKLHLKDSNFAEKITNIIEEYGIDPKYVEVELTESSAYDDFPALAEFVKRMKNEGIFTSMDDFGTGYSSLSMLRDLDVDVIKIDKSFIDDLDNTGSANKKMIGNIVRMIHDLDREVICEGIETDEQVDFLKKINCFAAQGFLYDTPLPHDKFEKRLVDPVYMKK